jgi:hypothetical protein
MIGTAISEQAVQNALAGNKLNTEGLRRCAHAFECNPHPPCLIVREGKVSREREHTS